jgi:LmbE family N-acetylglucosaminyl deacetylase
MAVLAHPDDESLGFGGVLARYASEGVETHLVTATLGERGRFREHRRGEPAHPGAEELARIRERELRGAARELGVREVTILGYQDGALDEADPREVIGRIAACVRRARPNVVITFPYDGSYGHPDHIAISQLTAAAVIAAADPGHRSSEALPPHAVSKLYYLVSTPTSWETYQSAFKKLTTLVDGVEREGSPWPEWAVSAVIDTREHWRTVWKAVSCHDSQVANFENLRHMTNEQHEDLWGRQTFYRVFSTVNGGRTREHDLFEGLRSGASISGQKEHA